MGNSAGKSDRKGEYEEFSDEDAQDVMSPERRGNRFTQSLSHQSSATDGYHGNSDMSHKSMSASYTEKISPESKLNANLKFYQNKKKTKPEPGYYIKNILSWYRDYDMLEDHDYYIQWLFPTKSLSSVNPDCQPLQEHEAQTIRNDSKLLDRAYKAYSMMLDFYGMQPVMDQNGSFSVVRSSHWQERYHHLYENARRNYMRITRIISSMGEMGFGRQQCIWLRFLLQEIVQHQTLSFISDTTISYWIDALDSESDRMEMYEFYSHLKSIDDISVSHCSSNIVPVTNTVTLAQGNGCDENEMVGLGLRRQVSSNSNHSCQASKGLSVDVEADQSEEMEFEESETEAGRCYENFDWTKVTENMCVFMESGCDKLEHCLKNMPNVRFYMNRMKSLPAPGFYLEELRKEETSFNFMIKIHRHIQWLFPTPDQSAMNPHSVPLTETEAMIFEQNLELRNRFIEVYELLLRCYGMGLVTMETGEICKIDGWEERFHKADQLPGLPKVITRILKSLGVLGFGHVQVPLVYFLLREAMIERTLPSLDGRHVDHWIGVIEDHNDRQMIADTWQAFKEGQQKVVPQEWDLPKLKLSKDVSTMSKGAEGGSEGDVKGSTEGVFTKGFTRVKKAFIQFTETFSCGTNKRSFTDLSDSGREMLTYPGDQDLRAEKKATDGRNANIEFYSNTKKSSYFWGHKIDDMLGWKGDYSKLEMNHQFIQWLFPIYEGSGVNPSAQALEPHEADAISSCPVLRRRVLRAYEMMLDFYGMELVCEESGQVRRSENWRERYEHLNRSWHNHLRITRIIKSLGLLGYPRYQTPWVSFILNEIFVDKVLPRLGGRQVMYWIEAISDEKERDDVYMSYVALKENQR